MFFEEIKRSLLILTGVFLVLTLVMNLNPRLPRFPWDMFIDKLGFSVYLPIITSIILTIILSILLNFSPAASFNPGI